MVQNSSDELLFVVAKVEHSKWYDGSDLSKKYGFSGDKKSLWKSAVFSMYEINSHIVLKMLRHIQILWQNIGQFHSWS